MREPVEPSSIPSASAESLYAMVRKLYPICRSITGDGVRQTLAEIEASIRLEIFEVPSGTQAFDWIVPNEWNIRDAYIANMNGERIIDFRDSNLHVLNYSCPVDDVVSRDTLLEHVYSLPEHPDWIPYRTTYYKEKWGFCITHNQLQALNDPQYRVKIDSDLEPGRLTYAEFFLPGEDQREILIYTHICHPSLCNDNLSGIAVAAALAEYLQCRVRRRYSIRLVFGPGTIGSIVWLSRNRARLDRVAHGLVLGLLGDPAPHTYKKSRAGNHEIDRVAAFVLRRRSSANKLINFTPYGYDERQFGSPGIDLPVGRLTRSSNGEYPEYHSSADNLDLVTGERLLDSLHTVIEIIETLENNRSYINLLPDGEPQLGKRGLYRDTGGDQIANRESGMLWILNQSDGSRSLLDIAMKSGIDVRELKQFADELVNAGLLKELSKDEVEK